VKNGGPDFGYEIDAVARLSNSALAAVWTKKEVL
jgi:hypothetical protein